MPGGLLNLVAYGNLNIILNGNPKKTFFKSTYVKYTNFGLQKFRIDFDGLRVLRLTEDSHFRFKVPRYADLFMDTYLAITLPTIWSPVLTLPNIDGSNSLIPYEFKWIKNLGAQLIRRVRFLIGGTLIQEFTGQYLLNMVERDFSEDKKKLFNEMIGNVPELNDPANYNNRGGKYPNAWFQSNLVGGAEPSIRARTLYIPLNIWFTLSSKMALPLISLQYNYLQIEVDCRPIQELFVVRNVEDISQYPKPPYIRADQTKSAFQFYRFLQTPPDISLNGTSNDNFPITRTDWYADIHLLSTYAFLSSDEQKVFAAKPQQYLIKEVHEELFHNVTGNRRTSINSMSLVASWMWFFQRSDIALRNEWSNYTNWPYDTLPFPNIDISNASSPPSAGTILNDLEMSGPYQPDNQKYIMTKWGLLFDGKVRESQFDAGVFNLVEKYVRTAGNSELGLYCYNFTLNTDPFQLQPSGAVNLSKFSDIQFEYSTYIPPLDLSAQTFVVCDLSTNVPIAINKPVWRIYDYNYNLYVMEERYNILSFESGNAGLMFAR